MKPGDLGQLHEAALDGHQFDGGEGHRRGTVPIRWKYQEYVMKQL